MPFLYLFLSNGIGRSGVFCAVSTVIEKIGTEEVIDVFQAVKRLRMNSPQMIESLVSLFFVWMDLTVA